MSLEKHNLYEFGDFVLDFSERTLWRENEAVPLAPKAIETLCLLVEGQGKLLSKDELMNKLWADTFVEERNLAQNVFTLRKALGEDGNGRKFIETVPRRGYRFVAEVRPIEIPREEFVEVSLAKQTTIRAESEGNVSSKDLAEAVKETAKSIALGRDIEENQTKQIETVSKPKSFDRRIAFLVSSLLFVSAFGGAFLFWKIYQPSNRQNSASPADFSALNFERLTDTGKAYFPALSRDKKQIVYVYNEKDRDSLRLQNLATGSVTEVIPPMEVDSLISSPFFSTDGNYIFYRFYDGGKEGSIYQVPIFGGSPRKIAGEVRSDASLSADGDWLSFIRFTAENDSLQIVVCRTDGSDERVVASRSGEKTFLDWGHAPAWSPDGTKLVVAGMTKKPEGREVYLLEINPADGSEKIIPTPNWTNIQRIVWHPNQNGLIVIARETSEKNSQIWYLSYPDGKAARITNDLSDYVNLDIASDGEFILTSERKLNFNLWVFSPADKSGRQLTFKTSVLNGARGLNWSRDGKQIVFTAGENQYFSNIFTIDVESSKINQLTFDEKKSNWMPFFTPDSQSILFASNRLGKSNIWQMDRDGGNLRQITDGESEGFPAVSPDGNWLFYIAPVGNPQFLYKRPFQGGDSILVFDGIKGHVTISPDSKRIVFGYYDTGEKQKDPWKYGIKSAEPNDKPQEIGIRPHYASIAWKKDGSGFYYVSEGRGLNNIWFYNIADGATRPVTNFDDTKMRYLSLSPDETRIVTARGALLSDAIKISGLNTR